MSIHQRDAREAQRALLQRIRTEGVEAAYEAALSVCRDPKAPAPARATASATLFRVAGYYEKSDHRPEPDPSEMTPDELNAAVKTAIKKLTKPERDIFD